MERSEAIKITYALRDLLDGSINALGAEGGDVAQAFLSALPEDWGAALGTLICLPEPLARSKAQTFIDITEELEGYDLVVMYRVARGLGLDEGLTTRYWDGDLGVWTYVFDDGTVAAWDRLRTFSGGFTAHEASWLDSLPEARQPGPEAI